MDVARKIILIAIDPAKRLAEARDSVRKSDVRSILSAIVQYAVDHEGLYPDGIDNNESTIQVLGTGGAGGCSGDLGSKCLDSITEDNCLDLTSYLVEDYLAEIPKDPKEGTEEITLYYINKTTGGKYYGKPS